MSTERELVDKFKEAFETKNIEVIKPHLSEDMTYNILPSSVGHKFTKNEWTAHMNTMFFAVDSFKLEPTNVTEHPLFVVVQTDVTMTFPKEGEFTQELLLLFNFSKHEDGTLQIAGVTEYMDSLRVKEWKEKMAKSAQSSE